MMHALLGGFSQFFVPTHLLAVLALGLWIGQGRALPALLFAPGLLAGSLVIASAVRETPAASALLAFAALTGLAVALAWAPPAPFGGALAFAVGGAVALNSPPHALTIPAAVAMQAGAAVAAGLTLAVVMLMASRARQPWQRIGVRVVGSWIAASAALVLALRLGRSLGGGG